MQKILLLALALLLVLHPKNAHAQGQNQTQKEVRYDSLAFPWKVIDGKRVLTAYSYQQYADGTEASNTALIGDSLTAYRTLMATLGQQAQTIANDVVITSDSRRKVSDIIKFGEQLPALIGRSPLDSFRNQQANLYETGWKLNPQPGAAFGIRFRVTGAGVQWRADTSTQWRKAYYLPGVIRLQNFNGRATDFFKIQRNRWTTLDRTLIITEPGQTASIVNRTVEAPPPVEPVESLVEVLPYSLNPDGTVSVVSAGGIKTYKSTSVVLVENGRAMVYTWATVKGKKQWKKE